MEWFDVFNWTPLMWIIIVAMIFLGSMCSSLNGIQNHTARISAQLAEQIEQQKKCNAAPVAGAPAP